MNIFDLFSNDIIELLNDDELFNEKVHNPRENRFLLRDVYNLYSYMSLNGITFDNDIMRKIIIMSNIYSNFFKNEEIPSAIAPTYEAKEKIKNIIFNMKTINDIDSFDRYYKIMKSVIIGSDIFDLEEQYKDFNFDDDVHELNGVCIITPSQTIAKYNGISNNDEHGYSYHDDNFKDIICSVYGRTFEYNYSGQDIKIRFINTSYRNQQYKEMTLEIPIIINSSQLAALTNLNNDLKRILDMGLDINIELSIIKEDGLEYFNGKFNNLDKILPNLIINDYVNYQYAEEFFVGQNNFESSFIKNGISKSITVN